MILFALSKLCALRYVLEPEPVNDFETPTITIY